MSFQSSFTEFVKKRKSMAFDEEVDSSEDIDYFERYSKLEKRCEEIKLENERLINNIYKIKKLTQKYKKQKKLLTNRLTSKHRDDYLNHDLPLFLEKDETTSQQALTDVKPKNLLTKCHTNTTNMSSKPKKHKPNATRNESTSNGTVCPKKPINPYLLFCQENRSSLQEKYHSKHNTEITHQELTKALAQQWHELSVSAKQVYNNLFNNDKVRYENEMKLFAKNATKDSTNESCD